jgi:hypothetical protein
MKKIYLITGVLLLSAVWVAAQQTPSAPQSAAPNATQTSPANPRTFSPEQSAPPAKAEATIQGCLAGSGDSFTLTEKSGKAYQLEGDSSKLSNHVGHEVQLVGSQASGGGNGTDSQPVFTVKKVNMLASSCSTK